VLGLPGNPVSALVCAILFLLPALDRLQGLAGGAPRTVPARLGADLAANDQRADHLRATIGDESDGMPVVLPFARQDSSMLRVLNEAQALILRTPHAPALVKGSVVSIIRLDTLGV
jgi:molybdopterin molybdotransferase